MTHHPHFSSRILIALLALAVAFLVGLSLFHRNAQALENIPSAAEIDARQDSPHTSGDCFACHSKPGMVGQFQNGETLSLTVSENDYHDAAHSNCTFCHVGQKNYPHLQSTMQSCAICHWEKAGTPPPTDGLTFPLSYADNRAMLLEINNNCKRCHKEKFTEIAGSQHTGRLPADSRFMPVCVDCHNPHNIQKITDIQAAAQVCSQCHLAEYLSYENSVHAVAFKEQDNTDVPTCASCHGSHDIRSPQDPTSRLDPMATCGECHADAERMSKYGLSTAVLETYLDDFHGRTVFQTGTAAPKAVVTCYDCHGVHSILSPADPDSKVNPQRLQGTCQQCHPNIDATFPQTWLSHRRPTLQTFPLLFLAERGANLLLKLLGGLMVIYIALDLLYRLRLNSLRAQKPQMDR